MVVVALMVAGGDGNTAAFNGMFLDDAYSRFAKVAILLAAAAVLVMGEATMSRRGLLKFEYPILVTLGTVGMMVMVSAGDLMTLYMGLELQSLSLYVVASLNRDSVKSTEAGLKYFVLGALSSGLLLYGSSLVYGYSGTTLFSGIIEAANHGQVGLGLLIGLVFVTAGLAFKVSAVPFHMWTPDVYEAPRPRLPLSSPPRRNWLRWVCLPAFCLMLSVRPSATGSRSSRFWPYCRCSLVLSPQSVKPTSSV